MPKASMLGAAGYPPARGPDPEDGSLLESTWVNLSWKAGDFAVSHDVYLVENFDDVNDEAEGVFQGNQAGTFLVVGFPGFPFPDGLVPGTTYYWRIDEVNDADPNSPWRGDVWSFWIPPRGAYNPQPADGQTVTDTETDLSWSADWSPVMYVVQFGTDADQVTNAPAGFGPPLMETGFDPGLLEPGTTYYWRADVFYGTWVTGPVWSFSVSAPE